jgi:hypothetical protein
MPRLLRYPWTYGAEFALWLALASALMAFTSFVFATPTSELGLGAESIPRSWEAAVQTSGGFARGFLIAKHPFAFAIVVLFLILGFIANMYVNRHLRQQVAAGGPKRARWHKVIHALMAIAAFSYGLVALNVFVVEAVPA